MIERAPEFHELVDALPEKMTCGRRIEQGMHVSDGVFIGAGKDLDHWDKFKSNGDRVCSYCGSLHPDDYIRLVREAMNAPTEAKSGDVTEIEPTDKGCKVYVRRPGVRNAHEGGIKFYTQHFPVGADGRPVFPEGHVEEFLRAASASRDRFNRMMRRGGRTA